MIRLIESRRRHRSRSPLVVGLALALAIPIVPVLPSLAEAQIGAGTARSATRNIVRGVGGQVRQAIIPELRIRRGATGPVRDVALGPDGRWMTTVLGNGAVALWDLDSGQEMARLDDGPPAARAVVGPGAVWVARVDSRGSLRIVDPSGAGAAPALEAPLPGAVNALALSADGALLLVGRDSGVVEGYDAETLEQRLRLVGHAGVVAVAALGAEGPFAIAYADGRLVGMTGGDDPETADLRLTAWSPGGVATAVSVTADGGVVAGTDTGRLFLYRIGGAEPQSTWNAHDGAVTGLGPVTGGTVASAGADGAVRRWSLPDGRSRGTLAPADGTGVAGVAATADGAWVFAADADGALHALPTDGGGGLKAYGTVDSWAVLDDAGRFDGDAQALEDVVWAADGIEIELERYAEEWFEPGLLAARVTAGTPVITADTAPIGGGIFLPPQVAISIDSRAEAPGQPAGVTVTATDPTGGEIGAVRLFHNGKRLPDSARTDRQETVEGNRVRVVETWQVPAVGGSNVIRAVALGWRDVESAPADAEFRVDVPAPAGPRLHLVSVGIDRYGNPEWSLNYAASDARSIADLFGRVSRPVYSARDVETLIDGAATRDSVTGELRGLQSVGAEDTVVVFLSGHARAVGDDWFFLPQEMTALDDDAQVRRIGLSAADLGEILTRVPARQIMLVIDACQSGAVVNRFQTFRQRRALADVGRQTGVHVLAASRADQVALEYPVLGAGLFTYTIRTAFQAGEDGYWNADQDPRDGAVTAQELRRYVETLAPLIALRLERGNETLQRGGVAERAPVTPTTLAVGGDFTIGRR